MRDARRPSAAPVGGGGRREGPFCPGAPACIGGPGRGCGVSALGEPRKWGRYPALVLSVSPIGGNRDVHLALGARPNGKAPNTHTTHTRFKVHTRWCYGNSPIYPYGHGRLGGVMGITVPCCCVVPHAHVAVVLCTCNANTQQQASVRRHFGSRLRALSLFGPGGPAPFARERPSSCHGSACPSSGRGWPGPGMRQPPARAVLLGPCARMAHAKVD